ncbi:MAG: ATP-binding protein [Duncaniella sp.]|nr:ATP-binding protein [Duncaniella sp.]
MALIPRPKYIERIVARLNKGMMIILIGQRRVGKSYMLRLLHEWILANRTNAVVVYINKELQNFSQITNSDQLYEYAASKLKSGCENYLLIDEVQDIEGYETALRSLHAEERCQIVATGSNAYIFSTELSTRLAGRYIEIPIYSLGYQEFLVFNNLTDGDSALTDYLRVGGLPGLYHFNINDEAQVRDYHQGVYNTIMMRDVVAREQIRNVNFIENLARFIADNIGKLTSVGNIARVMKTHGENISDPVVTTYLRYLVKALILREVARYDIHGKKLFEQIFKYYFSDQGLRNYLCGYNLRGSIEKIIENVVYNHLLIQGFEVTVGILRAGEVDFVAVRGSLTVYIQVAYLLSSDDTIAREFGNLAGIKDNFPKYVVSMDPVGGQLPDYPGIEHINLREFLKMEW